MDHEKRHTAPVLHLEPGHHQLVEREAVGGESQYEHHRVDHDGDYVGLAEHHVGTGSEVRGHHLLSFNNQSELEVTAWRPLPGERSEEEADISRLLETVERVWLI